MSDLNHDRHHQNESAQENENYEASNENRLFRSLNDFFFNCFDIRENYILNSVLRRKFSFSIGYSLEEFSRERGVDEKIKRMVFETYNKFSVGFRILEIKTFGQHIIGLVRPFIKVHILNINTGQYIKSKDFPMATPCSTSPINIKVSSQYPIWNQDLTFNAKYSDIVNENVIILFELLDDRPTLNKQKITNKDLVFAKRVAWAYLLPIGIKGEINIGGINSSIDLEDQKINHPNENEKLIQQESSENSQNNDQDIQIQFDPKYLRLQFNEYQQSEGSIGYLQRKLMGWPEFNDVHHNQDKSQEQKIPNVFLQWKLQAHKKIKGLFLTISSIPKPIETIPYYLSHLADEYSAANLDRSLNSIEEKSLNTSKDIVIGPPHKGKFLPLLTQSKTKSEMNELKNAVLRRSRSSKESCLIPNKLIQRIDVGSNGAMVVSFSHSGHVLAIASKYSNQGNLFSIKDAIYSIIFYDTDICEHIWIEEIAHHGVIYEIKWSKDDKFLLSTSGDGSTKLWDVSSFLKKKPLANNLNTSGEYFRTSLENSNDQVSMGIQDPKFRPPNLIYSMIPPIIVYNYTALFQEFSFKNEKYSDSGGPNVPRILVGSSDGRIRVWENGQMLGYIHVIDKEDLENSINHPPHEGSVNSMVIDERSKYLITADSMGDILAWRCDTKGWFQLLRKFKTDFLGNEANLIHMKDKKSGLNSPLFDTGILSLVMNPDKNKGQMLVLSRNPSLLRLINMSTYKTQSYCSNFYNGSIHNSSNWSLVRAQISPDGNIIACNTLCQGPEEKYRLQFWDSQTGQIIRSSFNDMVFPFPVRSITWHPKQHLIALSMVGQGASVALYSADKEFAEKLATNEIFSPNIDPRQSQQSLLSNSRYDQIESQGIGMSENSSSSNLVNNNEKKSQSQKVPHQADFTSQRIKSDDVINNLDENKRDRARELLQKIREAKSSKSN